MPRHSLYLAVYDLSGDREREHVAGILEGFGLRVQKSAFECRLTRSARERLLAQLTELKIETGFLYLYELGRDPRRDAIGKSPPDHCGEAAHAYVV